MVLSIGRWKGMGKRVAYKVLVRRNGKIILRQVTFDIKRYGSAVKARFPDAVIEQVGRRCTIKAAYKWRKRHENY